MSDLRPAHAPKLAALIALDEKLLSPVGRRRMERHLAGCVVCREALAAMKAADVLAEEARTQKWPEPRWDRMELALAREAKQVASGIRAEKSSARYALGGMLAAAAAVLLIVGQASMSGDGETAHRRAHVLELAQVDIDGAVITGNVTAVAGDVRIDGTSAEPGAELHEGARVAVGLSGARMHARLAAGTGVVGLPGGTFDLLRLREHAIVLGLAGGEVASQVRHLESGERYEVQAGDYVVHVRGTRFAVRRSGEDVSVTVDEGFVEVTRLDASIAIVHAPGSWTSSPGMESPALGGVARPHGLEPDAAGWPVVRLPRMTNVNAWVVGDQPFESGGELRMREPRGALELLAYDLHGVRQSFHLEVGDEGATLDPAMLHFDSLPDHADHPHATMSAAEVRAVMQPVVAANSSSVQRCFHTWAQRINYSGRMDGRVRITLDAAGRVARTSPLDVGGAAAPNLDQLRACVSQQMQTWQFPAQHAEVSFDANFTLRND